MKIISYIDITFNKSLRWFFQKSINFKKKHHYYAVITTFINNRISKHPNIFLRTNLDLINTQLSSRQIFTIIKLIVENNNPNLLVFGLGNDTPLWLKMNEKGKTVFLEDNKLWLNKFIYKYPYIQAYPVDYQTTRNDWKTLLNKPKELFLELPNVIYKTKWNIVIVDAPVGNSDNSPGRMKSIYMSSRLVKNGGYVFVHDCNRKVEIIYSEKYLGKSNLVQEVGSLRLYKK